jgi:ankyrin repeat protein
MTPLMVASAFDSQTLYCQQSFPSAFNNYPASPSTLLLENNIMSDKSVMSPQPKDVVGELIMNGASINKQSDVTGETSLHFAARYSRADAAKRLLDHNADVNAVDKRNRTPLHAAVAADALGVFQILLRHRQTDINAADENGITPLMLAVKNNSQDMVEELLGNNAQVDLVDMRMKTALHWAACVNNTSAMKSLLSAGANKDAQDEFEQTPLFLASREGAKEAVELLLSVGANRDIPDHCDKSPRQVAASQEHYDIVALLDGPGVSGMVCQNLYQVPAQALTLMQRNENAQTDTKPSTLKKKQSPRRPSCSSSSDPSENDNQQSQQTQQPANRTTGRSQTLGRNKGSKGGNSNHRRSSSAARATGKNSTIDAVTQLQQLQQEQQTQHTSPISVPMTRGPLLSPPSSSSPMSASTFSPGSMLSPLAMGGVSSPYSTTSSHVSSPPHHAQHPSMSFPSVQPMTQGFHTTTLMQQQQQPQLQMLQPLQHNNHLQVNNNQHQQHVPPPAYDEAITFNHPPLDVNSYFNNMQQSYGSYNHHQDLLDQHYLTPSPG